MSDPNRHQMTRHNDGNVLFVVHDPGLDAVNADFVHPFIAVDFDEHDQLVSFSVTGDDLITAALEIYKQHRHDQDDLLKHLAQADDLVLA